MRKTLKITVIYWAHISAAFISIVLPDPFGDLLSHYVKGQ